MSKRVNRTPWIFDATGQMEGRDRSGAYPGLADAPFHTVGTFTAAVTDIVTMTDHGFGKANAYAGPVRVSNSGGALPTGLAASTDYWIRVIDRDTFKLYATEAAAQSASGTAVNITGTGSGTQTLSQQNVFNTPIHISRLKIDTGNGGNVLITYTTDAGDELVKADSTPADDTLEWPLRKRVEAFYVQTLPTNATIQVWTGDESGDS